MKMISSHHDRFVLLTLGTLLCFSIKPQAAMPDIEERIGMAQAEGSLSQLSLLTAEIEKMWPGEPSNYFKFQDQLGKALLMLSKTNTQAQKVLEDQTMLALSKPCSTNPAAAIVCFPLKESITKRILITTASKPSLAHASSAARSLGEIRETVIPGYRRADVFLNVAPPIPSGPIDGGMDPKAIKDPQARAAYETAIAENSQRGQMNDLQLSVLPEINREVSRLFMDYAQKLFAQDKEIRNQADMLAELAHLTESERKALRNDKP
jgi:hypothetical protein